MRARLVISRDGRIALVNPRAEQLLGMCREDILGMRSEEIVSEPHRAQHIEQREAYFAEPWSLRPDVGFFISVVDRLGDERLLFAVPEPIASEDGLWVSVSLHAPERSDAFEVFVVRPHESAASATALQPLTD